MAGLELDRVIEGDCVESIRALPDGCADLIFLGRALLRDPYWALRAEAALDGEKHWPISYGYAVTRRERKK